MGLRADVGSRHSAAWRFFMHTLGLGSVMVLALMFLPGTAAAQTTPFNITSCGVGLPITGDGTSYTVTSGLVGSSTTNPCITINGSGVTLNMSGGSIDMTGAGQAAVAISVVANATDVTIENGTIYTGYPTTTATIDGPAAIEASETSGLNISTVTILNGPSTTPCTPSQGAQNTAEYYGTGISLMNVAGASIASNTISCFQYGIYVQGSTVPSGTTGLIMGNIVEGNTWWMTIGSQNILSGGIVLDSSNGWTVNNNTVDYNGGPDNITGGCNSTGTGQLITCQFSLQVINGSSGNTISGNTVESGFTGGIYAGPDVSGNDFTGNTLNADPFAGLFSSAPRKLKNSWSNNSCGNTSSGGTVPHKACL